MSIGLVVPSSNPTIESALQQLRIASALGTTFLCSRVRVLRIGADADSDAQFGDEAMAGAAALLADAEVEVVAWAGTAGFWLGPEHESQLLATLSIASGVPTTSSYCAMLAALDEFDGPTALVTPYTADVHALITDELTRTGHPVLAGEYFGIARNLDFARLPASELEVAVERAASRPDVGSVSVVCTNVLATHARLRDLPVVDSVLATCWYAAKLAGTHQLSYRQAYRAVTA